MHYHKESQFIRHASKREYEEVYTNEDMTNNSVNTSNVNYTLHAPSMFASYLSQEKAISHRRIMCEPNAYIFYTMISYWIPEGTVIGITPYMSFDFTSNNNLEECLNHLRDSLVLDVDGISYHLDYLFDKQEGRLLLYAVDTTYINVYFRFECVNYVQYYELCSLFNQLGKPFFSAQNNRGQYGPEVLTPILSYTLYNI